MQATVRECRIEVRECTVEEARRLIPKLAGCRRIQLVLPAKLSECTDLLHELSSTLLHATIVAWAGGEEGEPWWSSSQ